jgi:hypothetical protein
VLVIGIGQPGRVNIGPWASRSVQPNVAPALPARTAASDVNSFAIEPAWNIPCTPVLSGHSPYAPRNRARYAASFASTWGCQVAAFGS